MYNLHNKSIAIIGYTGFVGSNLYYQILEHLDYKGIVNSNIKISLYNSKDINDINGKSFDICICAGVDARKWYANQYPDEDYDKIKSLFINLKSANIKNFILISTVDVYGAEISNGVSTIYGDEFSLNDKTVSKEPYGHNRYLFEQMIKNHFTEHLIIRLPAMYGYGLKKNLIYDLLNVDDETKALMIMKKHYNNVFQFFNVRYLLNFILFILDKKYYAGDLPVHYSKKLKTITSINIAPKKLISSVIYRYIAKYNDVVEKVLINKVYYHEAEPCSIVYDYKSFYFKNKFFHTDFISNIEQPFEPINSFQYKISLNSLSFEKLLWNSPQEQIKELIKNYNGIEITPTFIPHLLNKYKKESHYYDMELFYKKFNDNTYSFDSICLISQSGHKINLTNIVCDIKKQYIYDIKEKINLMYFEMVESMNISHQRTLLPFSSRHYALTSMSDDQLILQNILPIPLITDIPVLSCQGLLYLLDKSLGKTHNIFTDTDIILDYLKKLIDIAQFLGIKKMVFGSPNNRIKGSFSLDEAKQKARKFFFELGEYSYSRGIIMCLEANHEIYNCDFLTKTIDVIQYVNEINSFGLKCNFDIGNIYLESLVDVIKNICNDGKLLEQKFNQNFMNNKINQENIMNVITHDQLEYEIQELFHNTIDELLYNHFTSISHIHISTPYLESIYLWRYYYDIKKVMEIIDKYRDLSITVEMKNISNNELTLTDWILFG